MLIMKPCSFNLNPINAGVEQTHTFLRTIFLLIDVHVVNVIYRNVNCLMNLQVIVTQNIQYHLSSILHVVK